MLSKRGLMLALLVVAVALGFGRIVYGSSSKKPAHHATSCATHSQTKNKHGAAQKQGKAKTAKTSCKRASVRPHAAKGHQGKHTHVKKPARPGPSPLQVYARALKPALNRSVQAFNSDSSAMQSQGIDALAQTCSTLGTQLQILEYQVDGVPHPGTWNTPVTNLHFHVMDIFHQMLGATISCQTSASNQDWEGLSSAQSDASTAAAALQAQLAYVDSVSR